MILMFSDVASVNEVGLSQLHSLLLSGVSGMEYRPAGALSGAETSLNTKDALLARKRKHETALLNRLRSLYLYGDEQMAEKDFIIERQRITDQLAEVDEQLSAIKDDAPSFLADDEFIEIADGRATAIEFKNGMTHRFAYK